MTQPFLTPPLSPPSTTISSIAAANTSLPRPRTTPLKSGTPKEAALLSYLTTTLGRVQGRVQNRGRKAKRRADGSVVELDGYGGFDEVAAELSGLVNVLWVSGSPNIQTPHLLTLTTLVIDSLPLFPPSPRPTFLLLEKLDLAFASLLKGQDIQTGAPLPWLVSHSSETTIVTTTDKVRIKGVVERMRLVVARGMARQREQSRSLAGDKDSEMATTDDDEDMNQDGGQDTPLTDATTHDYAHSSSANESRTMATFEGEEDWEQRLAGGVLERTLVELGDVLGGPPIGIITDD